MGWTERWLGLAALVAAGCGGSTIEPPGTIGELGQGTFRYSCIEDGDPVCNTTSAVDSIKVSGDLGLKGEAPSAIAVGGRFDLTYFGDTRTDDGELLLVKTQPARPDKVRSLGGFEITTPGVHAFLARSPKGIVADFIQVKALVPQALDVWLDKQRVQAIQLELGQEKTIAVVPHDGTGVALAGAFPYSWSVSGTAVAIDATDHFGPPMGSIALSDDEIRVYALEEGIATLTIARDELVRQIEITVLSSEEVSP
jgi:hypothetical protein